MFTARYALSHYIKQTNFVFKRSIIIIIIINNNRETKEIPRTGERNTCYVGAGCSTSGPDSDFSYGNNSKVTVTKLKET
jgi:hypothetical protein